MNPVPITAPACPALWIDAEGKHECDLPVGHRDNQHRCQCGAELRRRIPVGVSGS